MVVLVVLRQPAPSDTHGKGAGVTHSLKLGRESIDAISQADELRQTASGLEIMG